MSAGDALLLAAVLAAAIAALRRLRRKKGKGTCGGDCSVCRGCGK